MSRYKQEELRTALSRERLTLEQAKELAKTILASEKPPRESLAQLLSAIYGETVEALELGQRQMQPLKISHSRMADLERFFAERTSWNAQVNEFRTEVVEFRDRVARLKAQYEEWYVQNQDITETEE